MARGYMSFDETGTTTYPDTYREFNRRLAVLEVDYGQARKLRSAAANRRVAGALFSQHLIGLAGDFDPVPDVPGFINAARKLGLTAVDEQTPCGPGDRRFNCRTYGKATLGSGPHMHVQMFPAGKTPRAFFTQLGTQIKEEP